MVVIFEIIIRNSIVITTLPKYLTIKIIYAQDHTVCKLYAATASLGLREGPCEICTQQQKQQHPM